MTAFRKRRSALGLGFLAILWAAPGWTQSKDPDVNGDGVVNILDISLLSGCIGKDLSVTPQCRCADTNGDSVVDFTDLRFVASAYGRSGFPLDPTACAVPSNTPPSADAGPDQTVVVLDTVALDGSGSTDADGDPLTFSWTLTVVPPTSAASLSDPGAVMPTFFVDVPGTYVAELIVNDGTDDSAPDAVTITTRNSAPVAKAGPDQTALVTEIVILDGSGSSDVDGDALSFSWSFDSLPSGSAAFLSDPSAVNPSFVVDQRGTYVVDLVVSDGAVDSAQDGIVITTENSAPVADAGPDQSAFVTDTVMLDGSGSSDVDGDLLTFSWSLTSVPLGSAASLDDPTSPRPSLEVDEPGTYVAQLIVNDGAADSSPDTVNVTTGNSAPVADAGLDQSVLLGDTVTLDGTGSFDVDHDPLTFDWAFTTRPAGSGAFLSDLTAQMPAFTVDLRGTYVVQLVVHDGTVGSTPDTVVITTGNSPPVADAGPDQTVFVTDTVSLDGSASFDADLDPLTFDWSFLSKPPGSAATLSDGTAVDPSFTADLPGAYLVQLIVNDGTVDSAPDTVVITATAENSPPVADAGPDQTAATGATVQLDGSGSSDPDGTPLTSFTWSLASRPAGSAAALSDPAAVAPTFVADRVGAYVAELIVNDGESDSAPDTVVVTVLDAADLGIAFVNPPTTPGVDLLGIGIFTGTAIAAGEVQTCALLSGGTVKCWGFNGLGELGTGNNFSSTTPVFVSGITTATAIATGNRHACALLQDGAVKCWGAGRLGNGTSQASSTPVLVSGITTATAIAAGTNHTCAVLSDGTVRCWGRNSEGQLGNGTTGDSTTPVLVSGITTATAVAGGNFHTCALVSDGAVRCWGLNGTGNLGNGTSTAFENSPVGVTGISTATAIGAGVNHSCALLSDASVQCWGGNFLGQLGTGSATGPESCSGSSCSTTPVGVIGIDTATALGVGDTQTCAVLPDGTVKCWGQNNFGQLGDGTTSSFTATPVGVLRIDTATAAAGGSFHSCALLSNGMVRCWGRNDNGQLGDGTNLGSATPVGAGVNLRVQVRNDGPSSATSVTARFPVPAGYTLISGGGPSQGSYDPATGDWAVGSMETGARAELSLFAMVNATGPYDLTATITGSSQPDPNLANNTATVTVTPPNADVSIAFHLPSTPTNPPVGSVGGFFVIVRNLGPASTTGVTAHAPLPAGYTFLSIGQIRGTYDVATGSWNIGSLLEGQEAHLSLAATVNPTGPYDLTVNITGSSQPDPDLANNTAALIVTPNPNANLSIAFHLPSTTTTPPVGSRGDFFIIVRNLGPASTTGVTARVPLPAGYTFLSIGQIRGTYDVATGSWNIGSLLEGQEAHLSLAATVNPTGPYDLTVNITGSSQPDPDLANNTATVIVTPNPNADLGVVFINPPAGTFPYGAGVSLLMEVTNSGPASTTGVVVRFQVPTGFTVIGGGGPSRGTYDLATGTWTIGPLLEGLRASLDLRVTVNPTGPVGLIATITGSSQPDPNLANNTAAPALLNRPPAANAGLDQAVSTNSTVALDGSGSGDPDGDAVTQQWVFAIRPASSAATLANASTLAPSFVPDQGGRYVAQLTLTDSHGIASAPDTATIMAAVLNRPPEIRSTAVTAGAVGQAYRYDVEATDPDPGDGLTFSLVTAPAGMTIDAATGLVQWTPADTQGGPQNVAVRVQDAAGLFATQAFTVQVSSAANQAPVARDDAYEVRANESLGVPALGVLDNDSDADGASLTATLLTPTTNGTVSLNPDGSFTYTPHVLGEGDLVLAENVNLASRVPGVVVGSSLVGFGGLAAFAVDDNLGTSWRTGGPAPLFVEVSFPSAVTVTELQVFGHRDPFMVAGGHRNTAGFFQLFAADGTELHNSGGVDLPAPNADARHTVGSISGVRRARFTVTASNGEAGLAEFKVIGSALVRRERVPGNLTQFLPTVASASSVSSPNSPDLAIDDSGANWYAGSAAAGEFFELAFPVDVTVTELQTANPSARPDGFGTSLGINCSGNFALLDVNGAVLFDSGVVNEPSGGISANDTFTLPVPNVSGVRRVRWTSAGCGPSFPPGFSEFRVFGSAAVTTPAFSLAKKFQALLGREVHSTPLVANLTDDNGDGRIDTNDIPDIVVPVEALANPLTGEIKVVSGDDGRELFTLGNFKLVSPWSEVAVGNLDGDSVPEIVAVHSDGNHLIAFDLEGGPVQGNLTQLLTPLTLNVSTRFNGRPEEDAVDGDLSTAWFNLDFDTANLGASPFFEIVFPHDVTVSELQMFGQRVFANSSFLAGIFRLFAADGTVLFDSGVVNLPAPNRDITVTIPSIAGVRRVRFTGTADQSNGCCGNASGIAELNVIGSAVVPRGAAKIKWISDPNPMPRFNTADGVGNPVVFIDGAVSIANLDGDGPPEIVVGASVFDSQGRLLGDGRALGGTTSNVGRRSAISGVVDLDLDGVPEILAGPTAYRLVSGQLTKVWQRTDRPDGYVGIANFDDDPFPEIVVVGCPPAFHTGATCDGPGQVYMLNHDGTDAEVWNPPTHAAIPLPGGGDGGAPTVADLDGDGIPEIGVAGAINYSVFNRDGTLRWKTVIRDFSSHSTGSTVFDFDSDGKVELVYRDEQFLRVYSGADGVVLAKIPMGSSTWTEEPVVADVDNDGHADIVVSSDRHLDQSVGNTGVFVVQDIANKWTRTRRIWNQHTYHVTNVNEDGSIPQVETPHWLVPGHNNFRLNAFLPGEGADQADRFTYRASDGALQSNIATVRIALRTPNSPPVITSSPVTTAAIGVLYTYVAQASDPDPSDILTFSLPSAPAGMTVDPVTGVIHWTPTASQDGVHDVVVKVQDVGGLYALQGYEVQVGSPVTVPDVVGQAQATAEATITAATLTVGPISTRNSPTAPTGSVLSQSPAAGALVAPGSAIGFVVSLGPAPVGTVPDVVGQTQGSAEADIVAAGFVVGAIAGQHHATAPLGVVLGQDPAGGTEGTPGSAVSLLVSLGEPPEDVDLDGDGFTGNEGDCDDTDPTIHPAAVDFPGNGIDENCNGADTIAGDDTPPTASIDSPADGAVITFLTDIVGSVNDANLLRYTLEFAPVDGTEFVRLASGTAPVVNGVIGRFDSTLLENGMYLLRLTAEDVNGQRSVAESVYRVSGEAKVGVFALSFVDLQVPVSGIPITVIRSYDSRVKERNDFGIGWDLTIKSGKYQHNRTPGLGWIINDQPFPGGGVLPCIGGTSETRSHFTEVRLSDREVYTFALTVSNGNLGITGACEGVAGFRFLDGTTRGATLEILDGTSVLYLRGGADEVLDLNAFLDGAARVYNPQRVRLTTIDGRKIEFDRVAGVTRIEDINGNALVVTPGGVTHSSGKSISFARDSLGRITRITNPKGSALNYGYDNRGDLIDFTDQAGSKTTFAYDARHNLLEIHDPLGNRALRSEYDADGRLTAVVDARGNRTELTHNLGTRQEVIRDRLGLVTVHEYDPAGNIVATTDALGNRREFTFDNRGNQLTEKDPLGRIASRTYDAADNISTSVDFDANRTSFTYNSRGEVLTVTDPEGGVTSNVYDARGNLLTETNPNGAVRSFTYDAKGNTLTQTDPLGFVTHNKYNAAGQLDTTIDPLGRVNRITYDADGLELTRTATRTLPQGGTEQVQMRLEYTAAGRLSKRIDAAGGTERIDYDPLGRRQRIVTKTGSAVKFTRNEVGNIVNTPFSDGSTETAIHDAGGRVLTQTDRDDRATSFSYDELGNRTSTTHPDGATQRVTYDAVGRVLTRTDPGGNTTNYAYGPNRQTVTDALGHATAHVFDSHGRLLAVTDAANHTTTNIYDGAGKVLTTTYPDGTTKTWTYDLAGRVKTETDQIGRTSTFAYDAVGNLVSVTDPTGGVTAYGYDELGNRVTETDAEGRVTHLEYDVAGRLTKRIRPLGQAETFTYDAAGNILTHRDYNGNVIVYTYDVSTRLVKKTFQDTSSIDYAHSSAGLRTRAGGDTAFFDSRGSLVREVKANGDVVTYTYDAAGNRTSVGTPQGTTTYAYDALNRLGSAGDAAGTTTYTYDVVGNIASAAYPNLVTTTYSYDDLNRLIQVVTTGPSGLLASFIYTLDPSGKRTRVVEAGPATSGREVNYDYDAVGRLVEEVIDEPGTAGDQAITYTYDAVGNRLRKTTAAGTTTTETIYAYDDNDRLLSEVTTVTVASLPSGSGLRYLLAGFGCSPIGALIIAIGLTWKRRDDLEQRARRRFFFRSVLTLVLVAASIFMPTVEKAGITGLFAPRSVEAQSPALIAGLTYTYDDNGNTLSRSDGTNTDTYTHDAENLLVEANVQIGPKPGLATYTYDADGIRTSKTENGVTTRFLVDKNREFAQVLVETTGSTVVSYAYGHDRINQTRPGVGTQFYQYDGHLSTRHLTDSTGAVTDTYTYDAFGVLLASTGTTPNTYLFAGEQFDPNISFYYLRARYYAQATGRFITSDPAAGSIFDPVSLHRYLYANADPVNNADPTGRSTLLEITVAAVIAGVIVGLAAAIQTRGGPLERAKNFGIGFAVGFIITFALLYVVGVALSAVAARSAATIAAAEAETAAAEAAGQVAARLGPVIAEQTLGRLVASGTAETLAELGFGAAARAGLRTAVLRFTTQAGRQAFIRGLRREAVEALARTNVARLRLAIRELQIAIEELALEFGVF